MSEPEVPTSVLVNSSQTSRTPGVMNENSCVVSGLSHPNDNSLSSLSSSASSNTNTTSSSSSSSQSQHPTQRLSQQQPHQQPNNCSTSPHDSFVTASPNNHSEYHSVTSQNCSLTSTDIIDIDSLCGLGSWHPKWLQNFANKRTFLALFCLTSVLQGVYYTYFVSVLTTIEKLYQIPSRTTGIIMSSTEIGQISGALLLTYYGGKGHRPRWISSGMIVFACAALLCSTPHYLFGSHPVTSAVSTELEYIAPPPPLCLARNLTSSLFDSDTATCSRSEVVIRRSRVTNSVLGIFSVSLLFIGLGTTAVNTLGIPYIDDNVAQKESPFYFGITIGVRILGPVFGFLLGSICTSIPADFPFGSSSLTPSDTNWIGAWWLGLFLVGISLIITAFPMMIFPRHLPAPDPSSYRHQQQQQQILEQKQRLLVKNIPETTTTRTGYDVVTYEPKSNSYNSLDENNTVNEKLIELRASDESNNALKKSSDNDSKNFGHKGDDRPTLKGFSSSVKRLLRNDILLCRTASSVLHTLPISGLYTFLPKYLESQFQLTATSANIIAGLAGILIMGFGIFSSGTIMRKYKPSAKFVARWLAFVAIAYVIGMISLMFLGCPSAQFAGLKTSDDSFSDSSSSSHDLSLQCSSNCQCPDGRFEPVCMPDGVTYISPCLAGCRTFHNSTMNKHYLDCSCASAPDVNRRSSGSLLEDFTENIVRPGLCPLQCNTLTLYIIIFSITVLIHSTSEVGSMLLTLRCVEPQDKAMALGFISFATSLFGNVPCPILYGAIVDSTCLFWEEDGCGRRGACRLYDSTRFRQWFHGTTAFIMFLAFCIDLVVCFKADGIQFHEDEDNEDKNPADTAQESSLANNADKKSVHSDSVANPSESIC